MNLKIISSTTLKELLLEGAPLLIDLREKEDYDKDHIPGAIWHNWETIENDIADIVANYALSRNTQTLQNLWIICYCDHGNISLLVARDLARLGYSVMSLGGGWAHWNRP